MTGAPRSLGLHEDAGAIWSLSAQGSRAGPRHVSPSTSHTISLKASGKTVVCSLVWCGVGVLGHIQPSPPCDHCDTCYDYGQQQA